MTQGFITLWPFIDIRTGVWSDRRILKTDIRYQRS